MDRGSIELVLTNRSFLLGMVARGFAEEPDQAFVDLLASAHAHDEVTLLQVSGQDSLESLFSGIARAAGAPDAAADLAHEYVRLFVGPGTLKASLWETPYLTGKRVLFQPNVLDLREAYRQAGFMPMRYHKVSDDFIGIECDFVAKLAEKARTAFLRSDDGEVRQALSQTHAFLNDHLLVWVDDFVRALGENYGENNFYSVFARFSAAALRRDEAIVAELLRDDFVDRAD